MQQNFPSWKYERLGEDHSLSVKGDALGLLKGLAGSTLQTPRIHTFDVSGSYTDLTPSPLL